MISRLNALKNCQRGNFMLTTALLAAPLILVVGGSLDISRQSEIARSLQRSADAAALAALVPGKMRWRDRVKRADAVFLANMNGRYQKLGLKHSMTGLIDKGVFRVHFKAELKTKNFFGNMTGLTKRTIKTEARAEYNFRKKAPARLLPNTSSQETVK